MSFSFNGSGKSLGEYLESLSESAGRAIEAVDLNNPLPSSDEVPKDATDQQRQEISGRHNIAALKVDEANRTAKSVIRKAHEAASALAYGVQAERFSGGASGHVTDAGTYNVALSFAIWKAEAEVAAAPVNPSEPGGQPSTGDAGDKPAA